MVSQPSVSCLPQGAVSLRCKQYLPVHEDAAAFHKNKEMRYVQSWKFECSGKSNKHRITT